MIWYPCCFLVIKGMKGDLMTRSYKKLWHILLDRDMSRSQLRKKAGISTNALAKLGKDESLPLKTLEKVCAALDCTLDDILEYVPDKETDGGSEFTRF